MYTTNNIQFYGYVRFWEVFDILTDEW